MAGVKRNEFTEAMKATLYDYFFERYTEVGQKYDMIFDEVPSTRAYEMFTSAIGLGDLLEKPEGEDIQSDVPMENYTIICANKTFARKTSMSYEAVEDAQNAGGLFQQTVGSWGTAYPRTKDKWYADFFNDGALTAGSSQFNNTIAGQTDSSGNLCYDGKAFFATDHPDRVGNTYSNYTASNALTHTNLQTVWTTFTSTNNRDERGNVITLEPNVLLIPPALKFTADTILNSVKIPGKMDNDTNVLASIVQPFVWAHLSDADGWFLGTAKMGLMATKRETPVLDFWQDETNLDYYASVRARWGGVYTNWRFFHANNIASS